MTKTAPLPCPCCGTPFTPRGTSRYCGQRACNQVRARFRLALWLAKPGNRERMRASQAAYRRRETQNEAIR